MKKGHLFALLFIFAAIQNLQSQNPGCDGARYIDDVFADVTKTTVQYATAVNQANSQVTLMMDVYEPAGDTLSARPVVILAHGGSFIFGDKSDMKRWCERLARKGYVAASIQYRLYPLFVLGTPDSVDIFGTAVRAVGDMKCAARYFREDAATVNQFRADAVSIFVGGYSAGAVTALHAGFLDSTDVLPAFIQNILDANGGFNGNTGTASNQTYSSDIKGVINLSGGLYRSNWVDAGGVPLASIHGDNDGTVPYYSGQAANIAYLEGSALIHQAADAAGLINSLVTVPGGDHTDTYDPTKPQFVPFVDSFWMNASVMMESLVCATVSANTPAGPDPEAWAVYPNPVAGGAFAVRLPASLQRADVLMTDLSGKAVFQLSGVEDRQIIHAATLPEGIYTVSLRNPEQPQHRFGVQKLVLLR